MNVSFEASLARDLKRIKDKILFKRVEEVIAEVKAAATYGEIPHLRKMRGYATLYRVRLGDYRIGLEVVEDQVVFVRILHRKDIYRYFP